MAARGMKVRKVEPMNHTELTFDNGDALANALAESIADQLISAIKDNGHASLAVSGGSTPGKLFQCLSKIDLNWSKVWITLVDERCVLPDNERSNARLVQQGLMQNCAIEAQFVPLFIDARQSAEQNALIATKNANQHFLPFDVVVLGMGTDGHTASFFPDADELSEALDTPIAEVLAIHAASAGETRLTYNYAALSMASHIYLHIEGNDKRDTLLKAKDYGEAHDMPVRSFLRDDNLSLSIYWAPKGT